MSVSFGAAGTGANGTPSISLPYPASLTSGMLITAFLWSLDATGSTPVPTGGGWTLQGTAQNTDGALGASAGPRRMTIYTKVSAGTESGTNETFTITGGTNSALIGIMYRWSKTLAAWVIQAAVDAYGNAEGAQTALTLVPDVELDTGRIVAAGWAGPDDAQALSGQTLTAAGFTFGTLTELLDQGSTLGHNTRLMGFRQPVATGTLATVTLGCTFTQDESGAMVALILGDGSGDATVTPATIAATVAMPAVTVDEGEGGGATAEPATIAAVAAVPAPTASGGAVAAPATITAPAALPAPAVSAGATVAPSTVAGQVTMPAATAVGGAIVAPQAVPAVAALPAPTVTGGATVAPATVAVVAAVAGPTVAGGAVAAPAVVALVVAVPAPTVDGGAAGGATAAPAVIAVVAAFPTATVDNGGTGGMTLAGALRTIAAMAPTSRHELLAPGPLCAACARRLDGGRCSFCGYVTRV